MEKKKKTSSRIWWSMPLIQTLGKLREMDVCRSVGLVYRVSLSLVEERHNNTRENIYVLIQIPTSSCLSEIITQDKCFRMFIF